jgi:hypothetical protein
MIYKVTGRTLNTWTRLLQCVGCGKVTHVQVLHHLLLLQLQVQTLIYLQDKSPWHHSLTDWHSSLYATSNRGRGAVHSPCTTVNWCTYLSWRIWSGCMEIPILVTAAVSMWEAVDDTMRTAHSVCILATLSNTFVWKSHFPDNLPFSLLLHADRTSNVSRSSIGSPEVAYIWLIWDFIAMGLWASCPNPHPRKEDTCVCLAAHLKPDQTTTSTDS